MSSIYQVEAPRRYPSQFYGKQDAIDYAKQKAAETRKRFKVFELAKGRKLPVADIRPETANPRGPGRFTHLYHVYANRQLFRSFTNREDAEELYNRLKHDPTVKHVAIGKTKKDQPAPERLNPRLRNNPTLPLYDAIRRGSRVSIVNRFGQVHSGKAVMRGPGGWVLNMGGAHGRPDIATPENVVRVSGGGTRAEFIRAGNPESMLFKTEATARKWAAALRQAGIKGLNLITLQRGR